MILKKMLPVLLLSFMLCGCSSSENIPAQPEKSPVIYADECISIRSFGCCRTTLDSGELCIAQLELTNASADSLTLSSVLCFGVSSADGGRCDMLYGQTASDALKSCGTQYLSPDGIVPAGGTLDFTLCFVPNSAGGEYTASVALDYAAEKWIDFYIEALSTP